MSSQLCSEVNGGGCKNKVSARNGYICAAGHSKSSGNGVARPAISISKMKQRDKEHLARSTEDEALQWGLFRTGDRGLQEWLAGNPSISEDLQWELFRTKDRYLQQWLASNPSIGRDIAIELAKAGQTPHGYTRNKPLAELIHSENLDLLNQYPESFGMAYLERLLDDPQEDKEESKALTLHSYFVYEKSGGGSPGYYKDKILQRYAGDQEVALIISTEPAQ